MTPKEVAEIANGWQVRHDYQMDMIAWHAAYTMNVHLKKKVSPNKLLGKEKQPMTDLEREIEFNKLKAL